MKQILSLCLFVLLALNANGQSLNVDSLEDVLKTQKLSNEEEVRIYKILCNFYRELDLDKVSYYSKKILDYSLKNNDKKAVGVAYCLIGQVYSTKHMPDSAIIYYQKALDVSLEVNDQITEASVYTNMGALESDRGNMVDALEYYQKALSVAESTNDIERQIRILGNMGVLYQRMDNRNRALQYYERIKILAEEADLPDGKCIAYFNLGNIYREQEVWDKALEYELKALDISQNIGYKTFEIMSLITIAQIYCSDKFKEYDKAEKYATEGMEVAIEYGDSQVILNSHAVLSEVYRFQKSYEKCDIAASKAWEMDTTNYAIGREIVSNIVYANIYLNNKDKAARFLEKLNELSKKANDQSSNNALAEMETKYETEKKEIRIASLEKERLFYVWLGIAGIMLVLSLGVVLWLKIRNSQKEKQLVASNAIQEGEIGERERIAGELHDRLLGSLSAVKSEIDNTDISNKLNGCIEEVRRISSDLMPIALRSGIKTALKDFTAQFTNVRFHFFGEEKRIEKRIEFVVYCCVSELVANSVRHSGSENINVQLVQGEKHIALTVQDDGCGFDEETVAKGVGLRSIKDRVASCKGKMDVFSSPGKGTETVIEINI